MHNTDYRGCQTIVKSFAQFFIALRQYFADYEVLTYWAWTDRIKTFANQRATAGIGPRSRNRVPIYAACCNPNDVCPRFALGNRQRWQPAARIERSVEFAVTRAQAR